MEKNERLLPVDAVRGIAMLFIGVSHISFYLIDDSASLTSWLRAIGYLASPNFLLMSGLACGYQLARSATTATAVRIVDRGLFTFLVGHLLVTGSLVYMVPPGTAFEHVVITDTIGVFLCMAPLLRYTSPRRLLCSGATVFFLSALFALSWHPDTHSGLVLGAVLFAVKDGAMQDVGWVAPTVQYMGIFLAGIGLGKLIWRRRHEGKAETLSRWLAAAGSAAIATAVLTNAGRHFLKPALLSHFSHSGWADVLLAAMNVRQDAPPTPAYGLFYCGMGIALLGFLGMMCERDQASPVVRVARLAAVIGRASFISYVTQQWLIDFVPIWVGFDSWLTPATSPMYLVATSLIVFWVASIWGRSAANRYMTLGLRPEFRPAAVLGRAGVSLAVILLVVALNLLALLNASRLMPARLALLPTNPKAVDSRSIRRSPRIADLVVAGLHVC